MQVELPDRQLTDEQRAGLDSDDAAQVLSSCCSRGPADDFRVDRENYGDLSVLPTEAFFHGLNPGREVHVDLERGVRLTVELEAISEVDETGQRTLYLKLNGTPRAIEVRDRNHAPEQVSREHADPDDPRHLPAQMTGVVTIEVEEGDEVDVGQAIGIVEAMKMESPIRAHTAGTVGGSSRRPVPAWSRATCLSKSSPDDPRSRPTSTAVAGSRAEQAVQRESHTPDAWSEALTRSEVRRYN
jgi:pyruvate carboxylase